MSDCLVDDRNLSLRGDDYENIFITPRTFRNVNTQKVGKTVAYFNDVYDFELDEANGQEKTDNSKVLSSQSEEMCDKIINVADGHDNSLFLLRTCQLLLLEIVMARNLVLVKMIILPLVKILMKIIIYLS